MERQTPIMDAIGTLCGSAKARFCTPGHKGDPGFFGGEMLGLDITELPGADNLLNPNGAIKKSQDLHAEY
ncbi:MAG: arginine decarboxylase SpeA, partial [Eubacteriales bacterium]|nr:arginine decarboxylase SpeA [Eubacteriales bacterium]